MMTVAAAPATRSRSSTISGFNVVPAKVELQRKLAFPFVTLVMTMLAVPFGVTTGRRGTLYGIGLGIVIALMPTGSCSACSWRWEKGERSPPFWPPGPPTSSCLPAPVYMFLTART